MSKKWPWTSKMCDSCLPKGQAGIQVFCVSCWGSKLTAGSQTCELQNNNMCSSCETHVIYFGMWNTVKKKPAFRYQTSLNLFMWKFLWIYGELFLFACIAVMQCFLQTLEHFCSTMLKIWHVDARTLNFKFILFTYAWLIQVFKFI